MSWKFVVSLIVALIVAIFAILNSEPVAINFLIKKAIISQALVILISVIIGALIVALLGSISRFQMAGQLKEEKQKVEELEKIVEGFSEQTPVHHQPAAQNMYEEIVTEPAAMEKPMENIESNHEEIL